MQSGRWIFPCVWELDEPRFEELPYVQFGDAVFNGRLGLIQQQHRGPIAIHAISAFFPR
jgi:hypothetical protein